MNKREEALLLLDILAQDLATQLQKVDDVEEDIKFKLNAIKYLTDEYEINKMNSEIKVLLDWWEENTGLDYSYFEN